MVDFCLATISSVGSGARNSTMDDAGAILPHACSTDDDDGSRARSAVGDTAEDAIMLFAAACEEDMRVEVREMGRNAQEPYDAANLTSWAFMVNCVVEN